jgi:hypothetical protein
MVLEIISYKPRVFNYNIMDIECTGRRIGDMETLVQEVDAWTKRRNEHENKINWKFTQKVADEKISKCQSICQIKRTFEEYYQNGIYEGRELIIVCKKMDGNI